MGLKDTISNQVERYENFCITKHTLERDIEVVFAKRDAKAVMDIALAERELESTMRECEILSARVTRAYHGDLETTQGHRMPTHFTNHQGITGVTRAPLNMLTASKQTRPADQGVPTPPASLSGQSSDTVLKQRQADSQRDTNYDQRIEGDLSNEFFALLVHRYTDLCHERQILQEEIEDEIERKERLATEKLRCAIIHLETIREKAIEVVAVLNEASEGDTQVRLPARELDKTHIVSPIDSYPKNANNSFPPPHDAPASLSPAAHSTLTEPVPDNTDSKNTTIPTVVGQVPLPSVPRGVTINQIAGLISELRRTPAPPPPPPPPPKPPSYVTATQRAIFQKYDELMKAAKVAGAAVPMSAVPWPLLVSHAHQYPMQNVMEKDLMSSSVVGFIFLYSRWKGWNLRNDGQSMREDWEKLLLVIPEHIPWGRGRACALKFFRSFVS